MKRFLFIIFLRICLQASNISHIKWYGDYENALKLAKSQNKLLMVVVRKDDCKECKKLFATTFTNQLYIEELNSNYISIIATYNDDYRESDYPIELFYTDIFPTIFFINQNTSTFSRNPIYGYISPKSFSDICKKI